MISFLFCLTVIAINAVQSNAYTYPNPGPSPQLQCRTGYCNVNNIPPYGPRYPSDGASDRVGVSPGCETNENSESEEIEYPSPCPNHPAPKCDQPTKQLPVSMCFQLPPGTPLKLTPCLLKQIIQTLTAGENVPQEPPCTEQPPCPPSSTPQPPPPPPQPCPNAVAPQPSVPASPPIYLPPVYPTTAEPSTSTISPTYPPHQSVLYEPYIPPNYPTACGQGSCRSSLTPRYNQ